MFTRTNVYKKIHFYKKIKQNKQENVRMEKNELRIAAYNWSLV